MAELVMSPSKGGGPGYRALTWGGMGLDVKMGMTTRKGKGRIGGKSRGFQKGGSICQAAAKKVKIRFTTEDMGSGLFGRNFWGGGAGQGQEQARGN